MPTLKSLNSPFACRIQTHQSTEGVPCFFVGLCLVPEISTTNKHHLSSLPNSIDMHTRVPTVA